MPQMDGADFSIESRSTPNYNCLAWAMSDCSRNWAPALEGGYHWPADLLVGLPTLELVTELFQRESYELCDSADYVPGAEKVALYIDAYREVRHVARQVPGGRWVSKMGDLADIEHGALEPLECRLYGKVEAILCRSAAADEVELPARLILP